MINSSSFHFSEEQTIIFTEILKKNFWIAIKKCIFVVFWWISRMNRWSWQQTMRFIDLYSGRRLLLYMTFVLMIMTSKHFWLLQCIYHQTRVTYPWFITTCSHWNHFIWSQELCEHKFLVSKKVLLFYRSMLRLSSQRSVTIFNGFSGCKWYYIMDMWP